MSKPAPLITDNEILDAIGAKALADAGYTEAAVKKWRQRGISYRERHAVLALYAAAIDRKTVPAELLGHRSVMPVEERRARRKAA